MTIARGWDHLDDRTIRDVVPILDTDQFVIIDVQCFRDLPCRAAKPELIVEPIAKDAIGCLMPLATEHIGYSAHTTIVCSFVPDHLSSPTIKS